MKHSNKIIYFFLVIVFLLFFSGEKTKFISLKASLPESIIKEDTSAFILELLQKNQNKFNLDVNHLEKYEVQIIYTRIDRDSNNIPHFTHFKYGVNSNLYFNPASMVKLPVILLALEKLKKINITGLNRQTRIRIDSSHDCQRKIIKDFNAPNGIPTIENYIKKILLVSDNDAYNVLFDFLGQKYMNERLWQMGYSKTCIIQRFNLCCTDCNRYSSPISFYNKKNQLIYSQQMMINQDVYKNPLGEIMLGKAYINSKGKFIRAPMNFTFSNNLPLQDIHDLFLNIIFPEQIIPGKKIEISADDYPFLLTYLALYPRESKIPVYKNSSYFPDNFKKYFLYGHSQKHITDTSIRIFNIVGQHLGYLSDCAYIVDFKNKSEFILTACINTNTDQIFNSAQYKYDQIGLPFLENLGQLFLEYEQTRPKTYPPNLSYLRQLIHFADK